LGKVSNRGDLFPVCIEIKVSGRRLQISKGEVLRFEFDVVMAWNVDRLGRSLQDLVGFLSEIHAAGVDLFLHQQGLDTTTPAGKAMFQMLGVFAEFERSIIQERVRAGLRSQMPLPILTAMWSER
jgi:DNA invertase Pin-like site-specific DNA recombinase